MGRRYALSWSAVSDGLRATLPMLPDPSLSSSPPPGQDGVEGTLLAFSGLLRELHYVPHRFS